MEYCLVGVDSLIRSTKHYSKSNYSLIMFKHNCAKCVSERKIDCFLVFILHTGIDGTKSYVIW